MASSAMEWQLNVHRFLHVCEEYLREAQPEQPSSSSSSSSSSISTNTNTDSCNFKKAAQLLSEALAMEQTFKRDQSSSTGELRALVVEVQKKLLDVVQREKIALAARLLLHRNKQEQEQLQRGANATLGEIVRMAPLATLKSKKGKTTIPGDVNPDNTSRLRTDLGSGSSRSGGIMGEEDDSAMSGSDTTSAARITQLLQQQKDISTQEIEEERKVQSVLTAELAEMTSVLKEATLQIHSSVASQNIQLDSLQQHTAENMEELNSQKKKMGQREKGMKRSIMSSVGSIFWIVIMFVLTYAVIRLFPKP